MNIRIGILVACVVLSCVFAGWMASDYWRSSNETGSEERGSRQFTVPLSEISDDDLLDELNSRGAPFPVPSSTLPPSTTLSVPTSTLHPKVQTQGEALVLAVVEQYEDSWPWVRTAWNAAEVTFFGDALPEPCTGFPACVIGGQRVWFTLESVRPPPERNSNSIFSFGDQSSHEDTILHELGHVANSVNGAHLLTDAFANYYAGCSTKRALHVDLPSELLVDAMAMAVKGVNTDGYGYYVDNFWGDSGFSGCLVEASAPPSHLQQMVWDELFNCESAQAAEARQQLEDSMAESFDGTLEPWARKQPQRGDMYALSVCHGISCETQTSGIGLSSMFSKYTCDGWEGFMSPDCNSDAAAELKAEAERAMGDQPHWWSPSAQQAHTLAVCHGIVCDQNSMFAECMAQEKS